MRLQTNVLHQRIFYLLSINTLSSFFAAVPKSDPYIEGNKHKYSPGELVELNCTSNSSDPEADLFWYINAIPVSIGYANESKTWNPFVICLCKDCNENMLGNHNGWNGPYNFRNVLKD